MTKITNQTVLYLAKLTKIPLDPEQIDSLTQDLSELVGYVEKLDECDTERLIATAQVTGLSNVSRKDELIDYHVSQADLLKNSVAQQDGYIKVPKVL